MQHATSYPSLTAAMSGFSELARSRGLQVGVQENTDALKAARLGMLQHREQLRYALKAIYCCSEEDGQVFDQLFNQFWGRKKAAIKSRMQMQVASNQQSSKGSLVIMGEGKQEEGKEEARNVSGANASERLRRTDFSKVSDIESEFLEELALQLWRQMSLRLKRRMKAMSKKGSVDLRQTIRRSIGSGGDPIDLLMKNRKRRKQRLVILLDVSGSMDKYSFFLLRFICELRTHFEHIEAFLFSTRLVRISDFLQAQQLSMTLQQLSMQANHWSGGTRIGECFRTFNETFAKRVLSGPTTVIILSDGLDTGDPELLGQEVRKIHRRAKRLLWLNPLKGTRNYEPTARGMKAALPEIDHFSSAHNLNSLLELEKYLFYV